MTENEKIVDYFIKRAVSGVTDEMVADGHSWYSYVLNLPDPEQIIYTLAMVNMQVMNGGFHQYFFNKYGMFAELALENFQQIKAEKSAAILRRAIELVNPDGLPENEFRELILERKLTGIVDFDSQLMKDLDMLDSEYYELEEDEDLSALFVAYLRLTDQLPPEV